jgi:hypothetical protein
VLGNCCTQVNACLANLQCAQLMHCYLTNCAGSADPNTCATTTCGACYSASSQWLGVVSCLFSYCGTPCDPLLP